MKARKVRGLDPSGTLADNTERIVGARLTELCDFVPAVLDVERVTELHDMRIAAKRLRYVLEVTAEPCFGPYARTAAKRAKELQDLLGEIHDCDVQLPRVEQLLVTLRDEDADELRRRAGDADDLDPALASRLPHADIWRGLVALETYLRARRDLLYGRFLIFWRDREREGFRARLEYAIGERPEVEAPPASAARPAPAPSTTSPGPPPSRRVPESVPAGAAPEPLPAGAAPEPLPGDAQPEPVPTGAMPEPVPTGAVPGLAPVAARAPDVEPTVRPLAPPAPRRSPLAQSGDAGADEGRER